MTTPTREKFSSQAAPEVLAALRQIAENQGRQFHAVLDEALRDYIYRQQKGAPSPPCDGLFCIQSGRIRQPLPRIGEVTRGARLPDRGRRTRLARSSYAALRRRSRHT